MSQDEKTTGIDPAQFAPGSDAWMECVFGGKESPPNCDRCGRFHRQEPGASWAMRYSGYPPTPDHEAFRCRRCKETHGPLEPEHGMRPETAGVIGVRQ